VNILELTFEQLTHQLKQNFGKGNYHASAIYKQVFRNGNTDFEKVNEFSRSNGLARKLNNAITCNLWPVVSKHKTNGVTKFVTKLKDGLEIESVIVPMSNYYTICISSQVGCKMKCSFCETARLGLLRNLTVEEIVGQVYTAKIIFKMDIRNIVFMGMGEPFDNFENVTQSIKILSEQRGLDFPKKRITISTIGKIDGIKKLAKLNWPDLNLAVSVNAPNDTIRSAIMPFNKTAPMAELRKALMEYPLKKSKVLYIEYVLIKHVNDSRQHAKELAEFLKPLKAKLNLISYNTGSGNHFISPLHEDMIRFRNWLVEEKVFVRIRTEKGRELLAACGQLGNKKISAPFSDAHLSMQ
jgi:23S rRNA (adenine2503-C2)-methyltransferase